MMPSESHEEAHGAEQPESPKEGEPGAAANDSPGGAGPKKKIQLPPHAVMEMMPRPTELVVSHRRFTFALIGCGTLVVAALLAMLFLPLWQIGEQAKILVRDHLALVQQRKFAEAAALCETDKPALFLKRTAEAFAAKLDGGSFAVLEFKTDGESGAFVLASITSKTAEVHPIRYQIFLGDDGEMKIYDFSFDVPEMPANAPPNHPQG